MNKWIGVVFFATYASASAQMPAVTSVFQVFTGSPVLSPRAYARANGSNLSSASVLLDGATAVVFDNPGSTYVTFQIQATTKLGSVSLVS